MNTISDGAQLNKLADNCGNHEKILEEIEISMNKELNNLSQNINSQLEIVNDNILVIH